MLIYPTIELQNGHCVSLIRGMMDEPSIWHVDPVEKARSFAAAGAEWIHVTDLDAVAGTGSNQELIREIIVKAGVPVQVAGGLRTLDHAQSWAEAGAGRMVIGTGAVRWPARFREICKAYPDQIVLAVDIWQGKVMTEGWTQKSAFEPADFVKAFEGCPLAAILCTDIDRDLDEPGSSIALTSAIARDTQTPVIASGLVKTLDDISALKYVYNIAGVIVGRSLFDRSIDLVEAIRLARPEPERVAEFQ
ncbi:MAG: 1-(5-phosphoribosyl)-5-[(5-phosphoribosylamino)methylideneamino] imidazole-4-carboxamide isomerase [Pseudomonadota bacterium]